MAWLDAGQKIDDTTKGAKQIGVLRETTRACNIEVTTHSGIAQVGKLRKICRAQLVLSNPFLVATGANMCFHNIWFLPG